MIKLKDILNEQSKFDALKNKIKDKIGKVDVEPNQPPTVLTREDMDEAWKQENCNDPKAVIGVGRSPYEPYAYESALNDAREKINIRDGNGAIVADTAAEMWPKDASGQFYCLVCAKNNSDL